MPLTYTALLPHPSEILIDEKGGALEKTRAAFQQIASDLAERKPDVLVVITSHGDPEENMFLLNVGDKFSVDMSRFGIKTKFRDWRGNMDLSSHLRQHSRDSKINIQMTTAPLDVATAVPIAYLSSILPENVTILPIHMSGVSPEEHVAFGNYLRTEFLETNKTVAVLVSAEFSSTANKDNPDFKPEGATYNEIVLKAMDEHDIHTMTQLDDSLVEKAATCGYEPILVAMGMMEEVDHKFETLSEENYNGITFICARCKVG